MTAKAIDLLGVTRKQSSTQRVQVGEQAGSLRVFRSNIRIGTNKVTQGVYPWFRARFRRVVTPEDVRYQTSGVRCQIKRARGTEIFGSPRVVL
jgi:hypothetical protein